MSVKKEEYTKYSLKASSLVTKEFFHGPRQSEIKARLGNPTVDQYVKESTRSTLGLWSGENPVYMITGLKFAKGKVAFRNTRTEVTELRFRHNIADPIRWTDRNQSGSSEHQWEKDEETIVAYKLLKIEKNRRRQNDSDDELILSEVTMKGSEWF